MVFEVYHVDYDMETSWAYRTICLLLVTSTLYYFRFLHWNLSRKFGFCRFQSRDAIIELVF